MNHMRERHLDGTVLIRQAGGIFEPLARPDLFITDADRANVITSRRKDRDASLIGTLDVVLAQYSVELLCRHCDHRTLIPLLPPTTLRLRHTTARAARPPRPTLELLPITLPHMPRITNRKGDADLRAEYDGVARRYY